MYVEQRVTSIPSTTQYAVRNQILSQESPEVVEAASIRLTQAFVRRSRRDEPNYPQRDMSYPTSSMYSSLPQASTPQSASSNPLSPSSWVGQPPLNTSYSNIQGYPPVVSPNSPGWANPTSAMYPPQSYPASSRSEAPYGSYAFSPLPPPPADPNQDRTHKCRYCDRTFAHESSKCRHEKEHFNSFPCPEPGCDVVSSRKDSLKRHLRLMHGTEGNNQGSSSRGTGGGASGGKIFRTPPHNLRQSLNEANSHRVATQMKQERETCHRTWKGYLRLLPKATLFTTSFNTASPSIVALSA